MDKEESQDLKVLFGDTIFWYAVPLSPMTYKLTTIDSFKVIKQPNGNTNEVPISLFIAMVSS